MPLDLDKVLGQVGGMVARLKAERAERNQRLQGALEILRNQPADTTALARKIKSSRTTWLVAGPVDRFTRRHQPPPTPDEFSVLATDGSHVAIDRHRSPRCYLINIGSVALHYGSAPGAVLDSFPNLYSGEEELVIAPDNGKGREQPLDGNLIGIKRGVSECGQLARLARGLPRERPGLALMDGTLILWGLDTYPDFVREALLERGFLSSLAEIEQLNTSGQPVPVASYISFTNSTEVVNALRVSLCPREILDTDYCDKCQSRECEAVAGIRDRELFLNLLGPGERSGLFTSGSRFVEKYYGQLIYFFYLRADDEIARLEVPRWVATDEKRLGLVHSLVLDQCRRGHGYPVALSEAHEQAVVTGADRENFWQLVEAQLIEEHLPSAHSAKSRSKRTRWV